MRTLANLFQTGTSGIVSGIVMIIVGLAIVVFIVYMSNAERRIPEMIDEIMPLITRPNVE